MKKSGSDGIIYIMEKIRYLLANFLDEFYSADTGEKTRMIEHFPFSRVTGNKYKAYVAAAVEELCVKNNLEIPAWVSEKKYFLKEPFFVSGLESLKAFLIVESPLSFRRRNIFVSENVLHRV